MGLKVSICQYCLSFKIEFMNQQAIDNFLWVLMLTKTMGLIVSYGNIGLKVIQNNQKFIFNNKIFHVEKFHLYWDICLISHKFNEFAIILRQDNNYNKKKLYKDSKFEVLTSKTWPYNQINKVIMNVQYFRSHFCFTLYLQSILTYLRNYLFSILLLI